jgi:hypothetical protein
MAHYEEHLPAMIENMLGEGMITDKEFKDLFGVHGEAVDDKGMKSQRCVHLTHPEQRKEALRRIRVKEKERKAQAAARVERAALKARKAEAKRVDRAGKPRAKTTTDAVWKEIRNASRSDPTVETETCMNRRCRLITHARTIAPIHTHAHTCLPQ